MSTVAIREQSSCLLSTVVARDFTDEHRLFEEGVRRPRASACAVQPRPKLTLIQGGAQDGGTIRRTSVWPGLPSGFAHVPLEVGGNSLAGPAD